MRSFPLPLLGRLNELFRYDPETGALTRKRSVCGAAKGANVGTRNNHGHLICRVDYKIYYVHRLIWLMHYGTAPPELIDHANGDRSDNRIANLRCASYSQNCQNQKGRAALKGAHYSTSEGRWRSSIRANGRCIHLGWFDTAIEAAAAYAAAAPKYHGEFARLT